MHWIMLLVAIATEVSGTTFLKLSYGFTRPLYSVLVVLSYALSFTALSMALKVLPIGLTYAIWSAVGTAAISLIGIIWFNEPFNPLKAASLFCIILGMAGLHYSQQFGS